jgi:hypothetical protein
MIGTISDTATCSILYMDETEVTNFMYLEYLDWLKMFPPSEES